MPGLFITNDIAPTAPGGADAAVADLHHPDAEEIRPGLHTVLPQAAVSGISGLEGDAEVEHGAVNDASVYMAISRPLDFPFSVKKAVKEIKVRKRYDAAGFFTSRRAPASVTESSVGGACRGSGRWSRAGGRPRSLASKRPPARVDLMIDKGRCLSLNRGAGEAPVKFAAIRHAFFRAIWHPASNRLDRSSGRLASPGECFASFSGRGNTV